MEYRPLNITVISADGIKDVKLFSKMDVYAEVSIAGYPQSLKKTFVHKDSGSYPKWNHKIDFVVDEPYLTKPGLNLLFLLKAESTFGKDKEIGSVTIPIHQLFNPAAALEDRTVEYQVITKSGKPKGSLKFSYRFGDKFTQQETTKKHTPHEPVTAYPAPQYHAAGASYAAPQYPPPQYAPPAGYPPQASGYGYQGPPPQQQPGYGGYGYPPQVVAPYGQAQKPKKNRMGGGLGMGLGAGLLGGLLVGEMASGIGDADAYADGYGDAMGDMGGDFDF